jgi:hypothetical protein
MMVAAFLRRSPNLAHTEPSEEEHAFASPRTWDYAIALMASCDLSGQAPKPGQQGSEVFLDLVHGCIGRGASVTFARFLQNLRLPDPDEVLDGKASAAGLRDDELYVLFLSMAASLVRRAESTKQGPHYLNRFVNAMTVFLRLTEQTCQEGRVDTIFVPMRQVARGQLLHQAIMAAQRTGRLNEVQGLIQRVFEDTPLKEFVEVLVRP